MSSSAVQNDAKKQEVANVPEKEQTAADKEKERNAEIVKRATIAFLEYRKALTAIISPELGVVDDLTITWLARYASEKKGDPLKKTGRMHVSLHTKTPPEAETGRQVFNSFAIDSNVSFERDLHPAVEAQEQEKKNDEEKEKKKDLSAQEDKIEEIVSAAAARTPL
jgi:hypothetical protein